MYYVKVFSVSLYIYIHKIKKNKENLNGKKQPSRFEKRERKLLKKGLSRSLGVKKSPLRVRKEKNIRKIKSHVKHTIIY